MRRSIVALARSLATGGPAPSSPPLRLDKMTSTSNPETSWRMPSHQRHHRTCPSAYKKPIHNNMEHARWIQRRASGTATQLLQVPPEATTFPAMSSPSSTLRTLTPTPRGSPPYPFRRVNWRRSYAKLSSGDLTLCVAFHTSGARSLQATEPCSAKRMVSPQTSIRSEAKQQHRPQKGKTLMDSRDRNADETSQDLRQRPSK
jgi:hypothetical protein